MPEASSADRLMIFIDGQNLLYACNTFAKKHGPDYRFDYREEDLEQYLINVQPNRKHVQTRFYTAIREPATGNQKDIIRFQRQYGKCQVLRNKLKWHVDSVTTKVYPFLCPRCKWLGQETRVTCQKCGQALEKSENKGVDVALATDLLIYGLSDTGSNYDVAILVSGDNDFIPVIEKLRDRRPQIRIEVAQFSSAIGPRMKEVAHKFYELDSCVDKIGKMSKKIL